VHGKLLEGAAVRHFEGDRLPGERLFHGHGRMELLDGTVVEGQFQGGQIHGSTKVSWNGGDCFEGSFSHNRVQGSGKLIWDNGNQFKGKFKAGHRHGPGKLANADQSICYDGLWQKSLRHGQGKLSCGETCFFEGEWENGVRSGHGKIVFDSDDVYEGEWADDQPNGFGEMRWLKSSERYRGTWENGLPHGRGEYTWGSVAGKADPEQISRFQMSNSYEGNWVRGRREGFGVFLFSDGAYYRGEWKNNLKHGRGVFVFADGRVFEGEFFRDEMVRSSNKCEEENSDTKPFGSLGIDLEITDIVEKRGPEYVRARREVENVLLRFNSKLRKTYMTCSQMQPKVDDQRGMKTNFAMKQWQFWLFCKASEFPNPHVGLATINRCLHTTRMMHGPGLGVGAARDIHDGFQTVLFREFAETLVRLCFMKFNAEKHITSFPNFLDVMLRKHIQDFDCRGYNVAQLCHDFSEEMKHGFRSLSKTCEGQDWDRVVVVRDILLQFKRLGLFSNNGIKLEDFVVEKCMPRKRRRSSIAPSATGEDEEEFEEDEGDDEDELAEEDDGAKSSRSTNRSREKVLSFQECSISCSFAQMKKMCSFFDEELILCEFSLFILKIVDLVSQTQEMGVNERHVLGLLLRGTI